MVSVMSSSLLFVLALVTGCCSNPVKIAGGFNLGGTSRLDLAAGGGGALTHDGLAFTGDGHGKIGAQWKGATYGAAYGGLNDHYLSTRGKARAALGGALEPSIHGEFGYGPDGRIPLAFEPSLGLVGDANIGGNGEVVYGDEAKKIAALYGDFGEPQLL